MCDENESDDENKAANFRPGLSITSKRLQRQPGRNEKLIRPKTDTNNYKTMNRILYFCDERY